MNGRYRAVVIGLGRMGSTIDDERGKWAHNLCPWAHTPCYRAAGIEVAAGADPHEGQRDAYRAKWGIETLYADYREMVEREAPRPGEQGEAFISHNRSHLLALTNRLVGGRVRWAFGHMDSDENAAGDDDLQGNGYLHYDNGVQGLVRMLPCGAANWQFELVGTRGRLHALADAQEVAFHKLQAPAWRAAARNRHG